VPLRLNASSAIVLGSAGLLVAALFFGGGTDTDRLLPIGLAALFVAGAVVVASLAGLLPAPRLDAAGTVFFALLAAFVVWSGLSVEWSIAPDLSWNMFNRDLAYLSFAVVGVFAGALVPRSVRVVAAGLALALGAVIAWALAGKVIPSLFPDGGRFARLRSPVGYWNAMALLAAVALVLGLWIATDTSRRRVERAAGAVLAYGAIVAVVLTYSRSGVAIAVLGALAWVLLGGGAFEALATLVLTGIVAVPVLAFAFWRSGITGDEQSYSTRLHDGALFAPLLLGGAAIVGVAAVLLMRAGPVSERAKRAGVRGALGAGALAVVAVLIVLVVRAGGPGPWIEARWHDFSSSKAVPGEQSSRFLSGSSNHRWTWWQEAWRSFEHSPAEGRGAGSFPVVNLLERPSRITVTEPHNLLLQALSDTGAVGFVLLVAAIVAAALVASRAIRRARGPDRPAALALAIAAAAYLVEALVDVDWDFVATSGPVFFILGVLAARSTRPRVRSVWSVAAAAAVCAAAASLLVPWLAVRKTEDAYASIEKDPAAAVSDAEQANSLNPLSADPLYALGLARALQGRFDEAERAYARAVRLQPDNPNTWFELGSFELDTRHNPVAACAFLTRALELDRLDPSTKKLRKRACL
jgi:hypothetical protein